MSDQPNGADVSVKVAGQEVNLRNVKSLNTIATIATLIVVCAALPYAYSHVQDTKESGKELVNALKEMTQTAREQNCLMRFEQHERKEQAEFCRTISR